MYGKNLRSTQGKDNEIYCDYLCMTKQLRGCSADDCDKYEKRKGKQKNHLGGW